ncbi:MAG: flavodoxin-dependent (E)-4-hydroxy-3-methylbut-2-enyl-diphosphate synthase [Lentisphaeria bacterium]|nr:flavodoxin-dependent (E)-4-hydroxy-3-methylbut-2-enyl-diphosphate synthase [Lentisphaeria bacterium]
MAEAAHPVRQTRRITVGSVPIGDGAPVSIQSMTNTDSADPEATLAQIRSLAALGCQIVRVTLPHRRAVGAFRRVCAESPIPVIADIHFQARLAVAAIEAGADGIRINPGNIGGPKALRQVAEAARTAGVPIRVGVNSGSLEEDLLRKHGHPTAQALCESALRHCRGLEDLGFQAIKVSIKASDVATTVQANRLFAAATDYPLHLGVTEAGTPARGTVKSAVGIGALLLEGIGDTLRVSLTAPPEEEIRVALRILEAVGLRQAEPDIVSCPTCGRTTVDLIDLVNRVEDELLRIRRSGGRIALRRIAIMGCVVNGPGEAREADLGIACDHTGGVLFRHGSVVRRLAREALLTGLLDEIRRNTAFPPSEMPAPPAPDGGSAATVC